MKLLVLILFAVSASVWSDNSYSISTYNDLVLPSNSTDLAVAYGLPKIKTSLDESDKAKMVNGLKAAGQFMKFLTEKNFLKTLTTISSVAGPIFMVASVIIDIAFLFLDIESPEMALMKKEFANLNNRIDKWGVEFAEIKRKIDWSAIQVSFSSVENTIINLNKELQTISSSEQSIREDISRQFLNSYRIDYKASGDILYESMINIQQVYSDNLFKAAQKYFEYHRKMVQSFMMSNTVLLTQAMQVEAAYVKLKYNNDKANEFVKSTWDKRMKVLKEKMEQIDEQTKQAYSKQYETDLNNLLSSRHGLTNQQFTKVAYDYFSSKYDWREWFVLVYAQVYGFKDHTVSTCQGTHRFRQNGRNIIVSSVDQSEGNSAVRHIANNRQISSVVPYWYRYRDYSKAWVDYMRTKLKYCSQADTVASVAWGSDVWFMNTRLVVYKKHCVHSHPCYNTFIFA